VFCSICVRFLTIVLTENVNPKGLEYKGITNDRIFSVDYFLCKPLSFVYNTNKYQFFFCLFSGFVLSLVASGQRYGVLSLKHCVSDACA